MSIYDGKIEPLPTQKKTLTEQWREGKLDNGFYYVRSGWSAFIEIRYLGKAFFEGNIEVLAPVPRYDEWKQAKENLNKNGTWYTERSYKRLEKKLEIATKALEEIDVRSQRDWNEYDCMGCAKKALYDIEMEGVK